MKQQERERQRQREREREGGREERERGERDREGEERESTEFAWHPIIKYESSRLDQQDLGESSEAYGTATNTNTQTHP